ncbi:MAG TPA: 50S ribosomal protein L3 [Candidatus Saccharimonadia bacterium]|nr:50S ribosomal protein L3 [Candidatus Saccharimonadia bacterium]
MDQLYAIKRETHQTWTQAGLRIPVTVLRAKGNVVVSKTDVEQYVGFGEKKLKNTSKPRIGALKKIGISIGIRMLRKTTGVNSEKNVGEEIAPSSVFQMGDIVKVTGTSKGMGFAGGMKRHGFHGGPKTHGQSDRERAPGSSASGTTPGRVFKGKRMAGRGGNKTVSIEHLMVVGVDDVTGEVLIKGTVPGAINGTVKITKTGTGKFVGLYVKKSAVEVEKEIEAQEAELAAQKAADAADPRKVAAKRAEKAAAKAAAAKK